MRQSRLVIKPIDLDAHASVCVEFRRDSFICSFGVDNFFEEAGPEGIHYIERLRTRTAKFPDGYVHVWLDGRIVGQMGIQLLEEPRIGYVNLFYLIEEMRGAGVAGQLQDYATQFCVRHGVRTARLSVSPTNARALTYYLKHGWCDLGPRPGREIVHLMECDIPEDSKSNRPHPF